MTIFERCLKVLEAKDQLTEDEKTLLSEIRNSNKTTFSETHRVSEITSLTLVLSRVCDLAKLAHLNFTVRKAEGKELAYDVKIEIVNRTTSVSHDVWETLKAASELLSGLSESLSSDEDSALTWEAIKAKTIVGKINAILR